MGSAATIANVPQILKNIWKDEVHDFQYENAPLYGMIPKDTTWDGRYQLVTIKYGGFSGRSATFGNAKTNKGPGKFAQMQIDTRDNFAVWSVDHKLITLSRSKRGALVQALSDATENAFTKLKRSTSWMLWRNGGGAIGKVGALVTPGPTLAFTLADPNDCRNIDIGDIITFANDDGVAAGGTLGATREVVDINEDTGVITVDSDLTTIAGLGVGDFVFIDGDYNAAFYGVAAYVPLSTPGTGGVPAAIWGMDRTDHPTRKGGQRFSAATAAVTTEIKAALTKCYRRNCNPSHLFVGPEVFDEIEGELGTNRRYVDVNVGRVGFTGLEFTTQQGKVVKVFSDADIPKSANGKRLVYGLNLDTWVLHTALDYPMWLTLNGNKDFMLEENANQSEGRLGGYGMPYTDAPGENFVLELTT